MKKTLMLFVLVVSIVGCGESAKKTAKKITGEEQAANVLEQKGANEYLLAVLTKDVSKMSIEEIEATQAKFLVAKDHLNQARGKLKHMLDLDKDSDQVKILNPDAIEKRIAAIEKITADIDSRIANLKAWKKSKLQKPSA